MQSALGGGRGPCGTWLRRVLFERPCGSRKEWLLPLLKNADGNIHFWQHDLHPIWLRTPAVIDQKLEYIHMNPAKEGLVAEAHHYIYSSASAYAGLPAMLPVEMI